MAGRGTLMRDKNGRYIKETPLNRIKYYCSFVIRTIEGWFK